MLLLLVRYLWVSDCWLVNSSYLKVYFCDLLHFIGLVSLPCLIDLLTIHNNESNQCLQPCTSVISLDLAFFQRGRPMGKTHFEMSYFQWNFLGWNPSSQGKAIVLFSHKHKHMYEVHVYTQPYAHAQPHTHNLLNQAPLWLDLYYINKNTWFSTNTWTDQGRVALRMLNDLGVIGTQHEHIITAKRCELALYPAKVTGDLLTNGPTTRHRWLPWKSSQVHQRVLCWSQMWFRLECGIGGTLPH